MKATTPTVSLRSLTKLQSLTVFCATLLAIGVLASVFVYQPVKAASTYTWNQTGTASWALSTNWTPTRTTPAVDDILIFNNGATTTVTNVPTQTIGQLSVTGNTTVNLQAAASVTLTVAGGAGTDLDVQAGSALNCNTTNALTIAVGTGATGSISGSMTFSSSASTAHRLTAADPSGITFQNGATFTAGTNFNGNAFGTTSLNSIVFANGSTYVNIAGSNPFGAVQPNSVVLFQTGSLFSVQANLTPSFSGRTYANIEVNSAAANLTVTGGAAVLMDNLTMTAGTLNFNMTGTPGHAIKGNVSVASGATLNFNPATAGTVNFSGASAQAISSSGTLTFAVNQSITIANTNGVTVNSAVTIPGTTTVNAGAKLAMGATLTNSGTMSVNGTFQINQGGFATGSNFVYGASSTLAFNNTAGSFGVSGDPYWPSAGGPPNVSVLGSGGITMNVARSVSGLFQYAAGVSGAGNLTLNGTAQINTGGFVSGSPTYGGVSSLLKYNTGGIYGRNGEWLPGVTSGPGFPRHVQLSNNTTLDLPNSSTSSPFQMSGDLTIDAGSTMQMAGATPLGQPLTIFGSVTNNGTFNLSTAAGGDLNVGGSWTNSANFNHNGRTVNLNGSIGQTLSGNTTFFNLTKASSTTQTLTFAAGSTQTVTNALTLTCASPQLLSLRSSVTNTQWKLIAPAAQSVSFVDVKDSDASGGNTVNATSSVDSLNNLNWSIPAPVLNVTNNATVTEGNAGTIPATFNVTLTPASGQTVTVHYATQDSSATVADNDYVAIPDTILTFLPGETSKNIDVTVNGDTNVEPTESFFFNISFPLGANISDNQGIGTITNDDATGPDYTVTTTGNAIVVTDISGNSDTLTMSEPAAGQIMFAAPGRAFSVDGGAPLVGASTSLPLSGVNSITINQNGGDDQLVITSFANSLPDLTINGGVGDDIVRFSGALAFQANRNLDVDLQNDDPAPGVDQVIFDPSSSAVLNGNGTATLKVSQRITLATGSNLQVANGNATLEANQQAVATVGDSKGLELIGGTVQTVGAGNVIIRATGGAGDFIEDVGVWISAGGKIKASAAGTLDVQGTGGNGSGGASSGNGNYGIYVTGSGSTIVSNSAAITITGTGGATTDSNVFGVAVDDLGTLETDGPGTLTINGTGGTVTGGGSAVFVNSGGVFIVLGAVDGGLVKSTGSGANAGAIVINGIANPGGNGSAQGVRVDTPGAVTTVDGPITITGTSAACGNACLGASIRGGVTATGTGAINLIGTGAASTGAFPTHGVNVRTGGVVSSFDGDITITGTGGNGVDNAGFNLASTGTGVLQTNGAGNIVVNADIITIRTNPSATINAGVHAVSLRPKTNGTAVNLGSVIDTTAGTLELSDLEMDRITAGILNVGNATSGAMTVSAPITRSAATVLNLTSGANIDVATGLLNSAGGNVTLNPGTNVFPGNSGVDVNSGAATLAITSGKTLRIVINNPTVDSGYTQLNVIGLVNLTGVNLDLSGTHVPVNGQTFTIVNNDGADAITGNFTGLAEGATIPNFLGSGLIAKVSYVGGSGNDAVLTVMAAPTTAPARISGQVFDASGQPVSGVTVTVSGGPKVIRAITGASGFYLVNGLEVGGLYTVTPSRANYGFAPANRAISLLADKIDAVFTGTAMNPDANPLESPEFFVRQQYLDFLSREPDQEGLDYWSAQLRACGADLNCDRTSRIRVSAAFFMSLEFQQSGDYIYRLYRAALGRQLTYAEFTADHKKVIGGADLQTLRTQFADSFVQRPEFVEKYQNAVLAETFVDAVLQGLLVDTQVDLSSQRAELIATYNNNSDLDHSRSGVLKAVAEGSEFKTAVYNRSFVLMEYFGYLQRDMDQDGFAFWVNVLNTGDPGNYRGMVCSFLTSAEYQRHFSSVVTHSNAECGR